MISPYNSNSRLNCSKKTSVNGIASMQNSLRRYFVALFSVAATTLIASAPAHATAIYTYHAPITYWADSTGLNRQVYAGLDGSGFQFEFETAAPLINVGCGSIYCQQDDVRAQVLSWHYSGGSAFMKLGSDIGGTLTGLLLNTDATGNILNDRFYLNGPVVIPGLEAYNSSLTQAHDGYDQQVLYSDYARFYLCLSPVYCLYPTLAEGMSNMRNSGSWTMTTALNTAPTVGPVSPSAIPEPESYALLLAGLGLMGVGARRRKPIAA